MKRFQSPTDRPAQKKPRLLLLILSPIMITVIITALSSRLALSQTRTPPYEPPQFQPALPLNRPPQTNSPPIPPPNAPVTASAVPTVNPNAQPTNSIAMMKENEINAPIQIGPDVPQVTAKTSYPGGITVAELANGLTIIVQEMHTAEVVSVRCFVKNTGSAYEEKWNGSGVSHLLEHLVAGGSTTRRTKEEIEKLVDKMGGATNAFTSNDVTCFYIDTTTPHAPLAIEIIAEAMQFAAIDPSEFAGEHKVVKQELLDGESNRSRVLWKMLNLTSYLEHPIRHPVIGYSDVLEKLSVEDAKAFYAERYVPNNQVFVVVGDVETNAVLEQVARAFAGRLRGRDTYIPATEEPLQTSPREASREMDGQTIDLVFAWPTVKLSNPDMYPLDVAASILTQGESSRLVRRLKYEKQLVLGIGASNYTPSNVNGMFRLFAAMTPEQFEEGQQEILNEAYRLREELVTQQELDKAKKQKEAELIFSRQTAQELATSLGVNYISTGDPLFDEKYVEEIRRVTAEDVRNAARKHLVPRRQTRIVIVPPGKIPQSSGDVAGKEIGEVRAVKLRNGIRVLVKRQANLPIVTVSAITLGGTLTETPENAGRSSLFAAMLDKGNKRMNAEQIATYFDSIGGEIAFSGGRNTVYGSIAVLKQDFENATQSLADCLLTPTFPQEYFDVEKQLTLGAIARRHDNPSSEMFDVFSDMLPETTPYHLIPMGTQESVEKTTVADLTRYHQQYIQSDNLLLTVFGDIDPQEAVARLEETFGGVPSGKASSVSFERNNALFHSIVKHQQTGKPTGLMMLGYPIPSIRDTKETAVLTVLNAVMSGYGYPGGWLHTELRGEGLVYSVQAELLTGPAAGYFVIYAQTKPETINESLRRIDANVEKARRGEITKEEFEIAKERIIAMHAQQNTTIGEQSLKAGLDEIYGLGYDFDKTFNTRINAVTLEEVCAAARKYFNHRILVTLSPDEKAK
ncbi:MAG: insulinase family protein [Planctomycetaceae bacterium]|jgi:zinc protease|nr:insulinase family protein [Planctomycetaceae bacterium]